MDEYFCQSCARALGIAPPASANLLVDTQYKQHKETKHTGPTSYNSTLNGVFFRPGDLVPLGAATIASGWMVMNGGSLAAMEWRAGSPIGNLYSGASWIGKAEAIRGVLLNSPASAHPFPIPGSHLHYIRCQRCGASSPT